MTAPGWRRSLTGVCIALACIVFLVAMGSTPPPHWSLLIAAGVIPSMALLRLWNDRATLGEPLRLRDRT